MARVEDIPEHRKGQAGKCEEQFLRVHDARAEERAAQSKHCRRGRRYGVRAADGTHHTDEARKPESYGENVRADLERLFEEQQDVAEQQRAGEAGAGVPPLLAQAERRNEERSRENPHAEASEENEGEGGRHIRLDTEEPKDAPGDVKMLEFIGVELALA